MKRIFTFAIVLMALTACTSFRVQTSESAGTKIPPVNMPNPASVYCEQNGNKLEIHTADDGSQSGVCVFPDGSTCDEWVYFRGECSMETPENPKLNQTTEPTSNASGGYMQLGTSEPIEDWWASSRVHRPVLNMMIILRDRILVDQFTLELIHWTQR